MSSLRAACFALLVSSCGLTHAEYISGTPAQQTQCDNSFRQLLAARHAADDEAILRISGQTLSLCSKIVDTDGMAAIYESMATSYLRVKRTTEALKAANTCIEIDYTAVLCREARIEILTALNRIPEARQEAQLTIRVAKANLNPLSSTGESRTVNQALTQMESRYALDRMGRILDRLDKR